jgi:hypothetical protein
MNIDEMDKKNAFQFIKEGFDNYKKKKLHL